MTKAVAEAMVKAARKSLTPMSDGSLNGLVGIAYGSDGLTAFRFRL